MPHLLIGHCSAGTYIHQKKFLNVRSETSTVILNNFIKSFKRASLSQHLASFSAQTLSVYGKSYSEGSGWHWHTESLRSFRSRFAASVKCSHWTWNWLAIKNLSVSRTGRGESKHIPCLQLIWSYGLIAFQTEFSIGRSFIIFPWIQIQTLEDVLFHSGLEERKSGNLKICQGGTSKIHCMSLKCQNMSIHIHNLKFICKFTFIYTHVFLRIPTCAYFQMSYLKSSLAPSLSAFGQNHVKAGGQPHFPCPVEVLGEIFIRLPWCEGQRWERNVSLGISLSWFRNNYSALPNGAVG